MRQETGRRLDHADRERGAVRRRWLLVPPTFAGTAVALLFWWWSLDPSMLPRSWSAQGAVSGLPRLAPGVRRRHQGAVRQPARRPGASRRGLAAPRVLYVHDPSDPVGNATLEAFRRRPEWTDRPEGYDVDFVSGWAAVASPADWTAADSARLQRHLPSE